MCNLVEYDITVKDMMIDRSKTRLGAKDKNCGLHALCLYAFDLFTVAFNGAPVP